MNKFFTVTENGFEFRPEFFGSGKEYDGVVSMLSSQIGGSALSDHYLMSFGNLYSYRSAGRLSPSIAAIFFKVGIPEYTPVRFSIKHAGKIGSVNFQIGISIFNRNQNEIILRKKIGNFFEDQSNQEYFLSDPTVNFIEKWIKFEQEAKGSRFKSDMRHRLAVYGSLVESYDKLEIEGTSILDSFKVRVIDDLEYNLVGSDGGDLDVVPALTSDLGTFNSTINNIAEKSKSYSDNLDLKDIKNKKSYKVIFSPVAEKKWKAFTEIKKLDSVRRTKELKSGKFLVDFPPSKVIGDIFSERIAGFILDPPEKIQRDSKAGESWTEGFDDVSNILHSVSGSAFAISINPAPELYSEIKSQIEKIRVVEKQRVEAAKQATGALYTTPVLEPINVYIEGLKDEFTMSELETLVDRVEKSNKPEIIESEIEFAESILAEAKASGVFTASWSNLKGEEVKIPVRSLELSLRDLSPKTSNRSLNVQIAESKEPVSVLNNGFVGDWYMNEAIENLAVTSSFKEKVKLRPHQVKGYAWLHALATNPEVLKVCSNRGALLADDMGLGKTIQVIRLIAAFREDEVKAKKPILVIGPVSLLKTSWEQDGIQAFFNHEFLAKNPVVHLKDVERIVPKDLILSEILALESAKLSAKEFDFKNSQLSGEINYYLDSFKQRIGNSIVLCSYETMRSRIFELASVDFSLVVLDEAQKIKNSYTGQSRATKALKADMKVAMTGTPIENSIIDLWSICDFVAKDHLGSLNSFKEKYLKRISVAEPGTEERKLIAEELERDLSPIWLRRTKKEILKNGEIPPIIHHDSILDENGNMANSHLVDMSDEQYRIFETQVGYFNEGKAGQKLSAIRNMLEACYAPWWAIGLKSDISNFGKLKNLSPKLKITFDILTEIAVRDEKVIIFANIIELQKELADLVHQWYFMIFSKAVDCEFFNGDFSLDQRTAILSRFRSANGFKAIVISPRSGGAGLNLVEANHVIHYTREWNPAVERQATDRAHRLGQEKTVQVYYPTSSLIARGKFSAEEHLANILREKREVIDDFTISEGDFAFGEKQFSNFNYATEGTILTPEGVATLGPYRFERLIAYIYRLEGYNVEIVGGAGDAGCDIVARSSKGNKIIQVKFTEIRLAQGTAAINEIRGAKSTYQMKYNCEFGLVAVTNSVFSPNAHSHSISGDFVELVEGEKIKEFLLANKVFLSNLK